MTKTKVVNFVGSPSVGKSLMSALTFAELKMMHKSCELVQEYAKQLVWQERFEELDNQWFVSREQYKMLKGVDGKVDWIVTDSPMLIGLFYNQYHVSNVSNIEKTEKMILEKMSEFENIYIFLEKNEEFEFEKAGRIHDEKQSKEIEDQMRNLLDKYRIEYLTVKSCKSNVKQIIEYITRSK